MIAHYDAATNKYVIEAKVKDEEGFETTKTFKMSENPGDDGNLNYEAVNDVLPPNQSLKDLFNRPIKSSAPKKAATTGTKKANGFPDVDINK